MLELAAADGHLQVLRAAGVSGDERQIDLGLQHAGQLDLGLLSRFLEPLQRLPVGPQVDAFQLLELVGDVVHQHLVVVVAAQMSVAGRGFDLDDAAADLQHRHVKRAAAQVEDQDRLVVHLVQAVGQRGRGRLVDDAHDLQAGDLAGVLGGLPLAVVEIRRHGDHSLGDRLAQVSLSVGLELAQRHRADLLRRIGLVLDGNAHARVTCRAFDDLVGDVLIFGFVVAPAHEALDAGDGVLRVHHGLAAGRLAHQPLAALGERDHRRRRASALGVGDHHRVTAFDHGYHTVCRTQVNSYNLTHCSVLLFILQRWE